MRDVIAEPTRSQRLKAATHQAHHRLDERIMAAQPFASRENYTRFLKVQYRFHFDMEPHYGNPTVVNVAPKLDVRRRLTTIKADLNDVGVSRSELGAFPQPSDSPAKLSSSLGWLYVAEGSQLGAAILLKLAARLGLNQDFGARHLAGHPDGRARHWREFTAILDGILLEDEQERAVIDGANAAFMRVYDYVALYMPSSA